MTTAASKIRNIAFVGHPSSGKTARAANRDALWQASKTTIWDAMLGLFSGDTVGRDVVLEPATASDMRGKTVVDKPSLEVVYETV